jgi:hypothetical protein
MVTGKVKFILTANEFNIAFKETRRTGTTIIYPRLMILLEVIFSIGE